MDYVKINEQIAVEKARIDKQLADMIAEQNAKIEIQRAENERMRQEAEKRVLEQSAEKQRMRDEHKRAQDELNRAELAKKRDEENKINLAAEAKAREEESAIALQKKIIDLQFQQEQSLKSLKDSFLIAANEVGDISEVLVEVKKDGSELKSVTQNENGSVNPLRQFVQANNS